MVSRTLAHIVLIALINPKKQILLGRKRTAWGLPGGHLESFDKGRETAVGREIKEETKLVNVHGKQWLFSHDETKGNELRLFDVFVGYYYEEGLPEPLVKEGIKELRWFTVEEAKKLELTRITQKAIEFLSQKAEKSFILESLQYLQVIANLAQSQGASGALLGKLKRNLKEVAKALSQITFSQKPEERALEEKTLLIVDDHQETLETFRHNIESRGYKVYAFSDPGEALFWIKILRKKINALVVDYHLPKMKGSVLIRRARRYLSPTAKVILMSADEPGEKEKVGTIFLRKVLWADDIIRAIEKK